MQGQLLRAFCARLNSRFWEEVWRRRMASFRRRPEAFAREVLGSTWWTRQRDVAQSVAAHRRTAVKSANGVGKTYLAADLVLWFLYTHRPSIVLTTAPTERQVRSVLWEEIGRHFKGARLALPGRLLLTALHAGEGWFALGLATNDAVRFQGYHADNLLIIFDEASGIPDPIWEAAEGVAVGNNNRILAIGNSLCAFGRFYRVFRDAGRWAKLTISALEHPNVTGQGRAIPGAVTAGAVDERVAEWCEEAQDGDGAKSAETFVWRGRRYRPNNLFRTRVLGEFPDADDESLIPLRWIEAAAGRTLAAEGVCRMAADVARYGADATVIGVRRGPALTRLEAARGVDTMETAGRIRALAYEERPESISIDAIGIGAGVVDRLTEERLEGIVQVNVGLPALNSERFANRRAELYWGLRERFRTGDIALWRDEALIEELASLRYHYTSRGQIIMESKEEIRGRGGHSPDRADMLALLFDPACDAQPDADTSPGDPAPSPAALLRARLEGMRG